LLGWPRTQALERVRSKMGKDKKYHPANLEIKEEFLFI